MVLFSFLYFLKNFEQEQKETTCVSVFSESFLSYFRYGCLLSHYYLFPSLDIDAFGEGFKYLVSNFWILALRGER